MTNDQSKAALDFTVIKAAIHKTQTNNMLLCQLFLMNGIKNIVYLVAVSLIVALSSNMVTTSSLISIVKTLCYIFISFITIKIVLQSKRSSNRYYHTFFMLYASVTVIMPIILLLIRISATALPTDSMNALHSLDQLSIFLDIILFSMSLVLIFVTENSRLCAIVSMLNVLIFLLLYISETTLIWGEKSYVNMATAGTISSSFSSIYYSLIISVGYILLGYRLSSKYRRNPHEKK